MKNLFKNLMLVAVAAMAFTACTETNDEVNAVSKKTVIKGVATIDNNGDDTRSAFGDRVEDENGNFYYESNWEGGESIRLQFSGGFSHFTDVDAAGNFEIDFIGDLDPGTTVTICSPGEAWNSVDTFEIPSDQTPLENSVDPLVHILKSDATEIVDNTISATMKHVAAYGKMTVNAPDFEIKKVEVSFNGGQVYTLDAKNVENNVFWFTTIPMDVVTEFTVTAYDAQDKAITKTVNVAEAGKTLAFNTGRVSTFSVSNLEEVELKDSAMAALVTDTNFGGFNPYDVTFSFKNGDKVKVRFNTSGNQYLHLGNWQSNDYKQPHYISQVKYNGEYAAISACNVAYENDAYKVTMTVNTTLNYTFTGAIEGLNAPEACDCFKEPEEDEGDELPEFVIPGEGGAYAMDYRYTKLVDGLDPANGIRVAQDNGWIWDIKFNSGLASIEAGDYTATHYFSSKDALEVDTYNGGFQNAAFNYIYPDEYEKVTTFNVQKQGDIYCITMIGSGGYGNDKGMFRCVYIGKIINE